MNISTVIKIVLAIVLLYWLVHVVLSLFGLMVMLALLIGLVVIAIWAFKFARLALLGGAKQPQAQDGAYKLWEADGNARLYAKQPVLADLANSRALEDQGAVLKIPNNARVSVIGSLEQEAVKVKVLDGEARGKTGWVPRTSLIKE